MSNRVITKVNYKVIGYLMCLVFFVSLLPSPVRGQEIPNVWNYATARFINGESKTVYLRSDLEKVFLGVECFSDNYEASIGYLINGKWTWKKLPSINNEITYLEQGLDIPPGVRGLKLKYTTSNLGEITGRIYLISVQVNGQTFPFKVFERNQNQIPLFEDDITINSNGQLEELPGKALSTGTVKKPTVKKPTVKKPTVKKPAAKKPAAKKSTTKKAI